MRERVVVMLTMMAFCFLLSGKCCRHYPELFLSNPSMECLYFVGSIAILVLDAVLWIGSIS
jgi:hypothetical protein